MALSVEMNNEPFYLSIHIDSFQYGNRNVFSDFSYVFQGPGLYILQGKNGSGKSTLLSILAGKIKCTKGSLSYQNTEITERNRESYSSSNVSYLTQDSLFFPDISLLDNVMLPYLVKDKEKAKSILKKLGLESVIQEQAKDLSFGEKQRLCLARALYDLKPIVLLDEITSGLDHNSQEVIDDTIAEIAKDHLVIFSTHEVVSSALKTGKLLNLDQEKNKTGKPSTVQTQESTLQAKENHFRSRGKVRKSDIWQSKSFYLTQIVFLLLLSCFASFLGNYVLSFHTEATKETPIDQIVLQDYLQTAKEFVLYREKTKTITDVDGQMKGYEDCPNPIITEDSKVSVGTRFSGICYSESIQQEVKLATINSPINRYPSKENEAMISNLCYENLVFQISKENSLSEQNAKEYLFSDYQIEGTNLKVVGVYQSAPYSEESFHARFEGQEDIFQPSRASYLYQTETIFAYGNPQTLRVFLDNTMNNREKVTKDMAFREMFIYDEQTFKTGICVDKNGNPLVQNKAEKANNLKRIPYLFILFLIIQSMGFGIIFYSREKRRYLLLRYMGVSRASLMKTTLIPEFLSSLLSVSLGIGSGALASYFYNLHLRQIGLNPIGSYLLFDWKVMIFILLSVTFGFVIYAVIMMVFLLPKDLSTRIKEIKQKQ